MDNQQRNNMGMGHGVGGMAPQNNSNQKKDETQVKTGFEAFWDDAKDFFKKAFLSTPYETIFELALLIAGATRTLDLMHNMGQSGWGAVAGLIYAEFGIILYEFLEYKGRRVRTKKQKNGVAFEAYPIVNQKSIAKFGLWFVHLPLTVFFTTSDMIMTNLRSMTGMSNFDSVFAWILGAVIGLGFFLDLILVINYKGTNPERKHEEEMLQIEYDEKMFELEKQKLMAEEKLSYARKNAKPLAQITAKMDTRAKIVGEYSGKLGSDYVERMLDEIDEAGEFSLRKKNENNQKNQNHQQRPGINEKPEFRPEQKQGGGLNRTPGDVIVSDMKTTAETRGEKQEENFTKPQR